ncbi:AAA family ATPase [Wenzhouxiangella sp. AB-CW3]|uniref:ExeA family protein n=1 Tax=Wenzhouxiangella sp. AB-CW3 TaxID=2771012 RepID=UPI00168AACC5|nr:ExeA family protein [Wenzhouxiangella sp. AB-CW3]QOC22174.1 AAA family ATPase [Wenzhouxiangella sp. AB-CW3]
MSTMAPDQVLGLERHPFPVTPDANSYFLPRGREAALAELAHCIEARRGILLVTGEIGLGKTTLLRRLLADFDPDTLEYALIFNTFLRGGELLQAICSDFGLDAGDSVSDNLERLNHFLIDRAEAGRTCLLVLDDAQNLDAESLEMIRLLSNLETDQHKLLQILLCGQPELDDRLSAPNLRQLSSRIVYRLDLEPLSRAELSDYVRFRLDAAGSAGRIGISASALRCLWQCSKGNPRRIHLLLDRCLYALIGAAQQHISVAMVRQAAGELEMVSGHHAWRAPALSFAAAAVLSSALVFGLDPQRETASQTDTVPAPVVKPLDSEWLAGLEETSATDTTPPCLDELLERHGEAVGLYPQPPALDGDDGSEHLCRFEKADRHWLAVEPVPGVGDRGHVREVQRLLFELGLLDADGVDGWFGPITRSAVEAFQQQSGLPTHGRPDALTSGLLQALARHEARKSDETHSGG